MVKRTARVFFDLSGASTEKNN